MNSTIENLLTTNNNHQWILICQLTPKMPIVQLQTKKQSNRLVSLVVNKNAINNSLIKNITSNASYVCYRNAS